MLSSDDPQNHNEIWLRWTDSGGMRTREERVSLLDADESEVILASKTALDSRTEVLLLSGEDAEPGIVIACRPHQDSFVVIIQMEPSIHFPENIDRDPGVLSLDDFVSEEQERLLLEEIENEWRSSSSKTRATTH